MVAVLLLHGSLIFFLFDIFLSSSLCLLWAYQILVLKAHPFSWIFLINSHWISSTIQFKSCVSWKLISKCYTINAMFSFIKSFKQFWGINQMNINIRWSWLGPAVFELFCDKTKSIKRSIGNECCRFGMQWFIFGPKLTKFIQSANKYWEVPVSSMQNSHYMHADCNIFEAGNAEF